MFRSAKLGRNLLLALILSVFLLPIANAGLVEVYINNSDELTESETQYTIESGKDLNLEIRLAGPYRIDSGDKNLSVESIYLDVYFDNDDDRRDPTSGIPQYKSLKATETDPGYDTFVSAFKGDDDRFENYEGPIRFSIIMKNASSGIVRDNVILITMEAPPSEDSGSSGFTLPSLPDPIADNLIPIIGGIIVLFLLSFGIYTFVLAPEDTTADIYKEKESIDPLKQSLTGVGYKSELPSESKLKRLENKDDDSEDSDSEDEEDDDEEYEYEDDDEEEEFDERAMLDKLTGTSTLKDSSDEDSDDTEKPVVAAKKKAVKKKVAKKAITKKKVIKKAAPKKKTKAPTPAKNLSKGMKEAICPSCDKVHHVDENTTKFICSCGRRIRV